MSTSKALKRLLKLFSNFKEQQTLSVQEYLIDQNLSNDEATFFLDLAKHRQLLEDLSEQIQEEIRVADRITTELLGCWLIFAFHSDRLDTILEFCLQIKYDYLSDLIASIADADGQLMLCQLANRYFDDQYVFERIIDPIYEHFPILVELGRRFIEMHQIKPTPTTVCRGFKFLETLPWKHPPPPANTPTIVRRFQATPVPTKFEWQVNNKKLDKLRNENRNRAKLLLIEASKVPNRLSDPKPVAKDDQIKPEKIQLKKLPNFKTKVEIKTNLTTTLREAARVVKNQEDQLKKIDCLIQGGANVDDIVTIEAQLKLEEEQKEIEDIEKKHLKGLISHEEAIISKNRLLEKNKMKFEQFKQERIEWCRSLDVWREQEESKVRVLVEKSQTIKTNAKISGERMRQSKQEIVKSQQAEFKVLMERAIEAKHQEMMRKIEIIQEIKALHKVHCNLKTYDPTETPNLGLLCEMSIAELHERLTIMKMRMQEELNEKKATILEKKDNQKRMVENLRKLIEENRTNNNEKQKISSKAIKIESEEVTKLKQQLEEKRRIRIGGGFK